jgi:NitT/TauT family transport system ATP-binding protein
VQKTAIFITHSIEEAVYLADRIVVMTRRPGEVKEIVDSLMPRPRTFEMRGHEDFAHLEHRIATLVREEVDIAEEQGDQSEDNGG